MTARPPTRFSHDIRAAVLSALLVSACGKAVAPTSPPVPAPSVEAVSDPTKFALDEVSIAELQRQMQSGERTSRQIVELYLARIEELDRRGPALHAVIELNPEALAIADALDRERQSSGARGPLHGIPVLLKDNIATADATQTTAGSLALVGAKPARDSAVAERLRKAGAVLLGKANLSEWANFRAMRSSSGWSARGGQARNPYVLDRNPCGSSSGSGVAVAANLVAVAIGTETDGSIVCPASANGIVGIKPTVGLVSRSGIIPISHSLDTAGPMARTVRDAAVVLGALVGVDASDQATAASKGRGKSNYTELLDADGLKGARIGVSRKHFGRDSAVDALMEQAIAEMRKRGAEIVDPVEISTGMQFRTAKFELMLFEFKAGINSYLAGLSGGGPRSLDELITFNEAHSAEEMQFFGQEVFVKAAKMGDLTDAGYLSARDRALETARSAIDNAMDEHRLDAIVAPTGGPAWPTDPVNGDHYLISSSSLAAVAGYPNITVPAGQIHGLPVGISFFGRAWSEPALLRIAYAFEQATRARRPPRFLPTLPTSGSLPR